MSDGTILGEISEPKGIRGLLDEKAINNPGERQKVFSGYLIEKIRSLGSAATSEATAPEPLTIVISGMASSTVGWHEVPSVRTPFDLDGRAMAIKTFPLQTDRISAVVHLLGGVCTSSDMMRGEETEMLGLFADGEYPDIRADGIAILPGTHSKHIRIQNGSITDIQTFLTGELFELLATQSLLRVSVDLKSQGPACDIREPTASTAFVEGVRASGERGLSGSLFKVRTRTVMDGVAPSVNRWFLSGLLIGSELEALTKQEKPILLAGHGALGQAYRLALETMKIGKMFVTLPAKNPPAAVRGQMLLLNRIEELKR